MNCCKCTGQLHEAKSTKANSFFWCHLCKGLWLSKDSLLKFFDRNSKLEGILDSGLQNFSKVKFDCPTCKKSLIGGKLKDTNINVEHCNSCDHYFFDDKELNLLLDELKYLELPKAKNIDWSKEKLTVSNCQCPLCENTPLYGLKDHLKDVQVCLSCEGVATNTHVLQKLAKKSLFGPSMFEFRKGGEIIKFCHFCHHPQSKNESDCTNCGRPLKPIKCPDCKSQYSEYELNDVVIDRCHFCNSVWLDKGEFEKVMIIMPDVKKISQNRYLQDQLRSLKFEVKADIYSVAIDHHRRTLLNNMLGPIVGALFFYD